MQYIQGKLTVIINISMFWILKSTNDSGSTRFNHGLKRTRKKQCTLSHLTSPERTGHDCFTSRLPFGPSSHSSYMIVPKSERDIPLLPYLLIKVRQERNSIIVELSKKPSHRKKLIQPPFQIPKLGVSLLGGGSRGQK